MNAINHEFDLARAQMLPPADDKAAAAQVEQLAARWDALHAAADAVAQLAQLAPEQPGEAVATLPERAVAAGGDRRDAVASAIEDLELVMRTGLRALLTAVEGESEATSAALTLWREFHAGRKAVCAFVDPELVAA